MTDGSMPWGGGATRTHARGCCSKRRRASALGSVAEEFGRPHDRRGAQWIAIERSRLSAPEDPDSGVDFEQPMDRLRVEPRADRHALGSIKAAMGDLDALRAGPAERAGVVSIEPGLRADGKFFGRHKSGAIPCWGPALLMAIKKWPR
jgi:hypothetical protein